jgi:conjugal transfer ATP-binding protein TraC
MALINLFKKQTRPDITATIPEPAEMQEMLARHNGEAPLPNNTEDNDKDKSDRKDKKRFNFNLSNFRNFQKPDVNLKKLKRAYRKLGIKTARAIKDQNVFDTVPSDRLAALSDKQMQKLFKRNRLGDYLPYWLYDTESGTYVNNDGSFGVIYEASPRLAMDGKVATSIVEVLSKLPEGIILQIVLMGGANNYDRIKQWEAEHLTRDALANGAISDISDFLLQKHLEPIGDTMITRIKNYHLYFTLRSENYKALSVASNQLKGVLSSNHFHPSVCHPERLTPILYETLNGDVDPKDIPAYTPYKEINRQLIGSETEIAFFNDYVRISSKANRRLDGEAKGKYWQALAPQTLPEEAHIFHFGEKLGDKLSSVLNTNQFVNNFIVSVAIAKRPPKVADKIKRNHKANLYMKLPEAFFRVLANVRKESVEILDRIVEKREAIYSFDLDVLVAGDNYDDMEHNAAVIQSYWHKGDGAMTLAKIPDVNHLAFLASLPMSATPEYIETCAKSFSMFPGQLAQFIPAEADYTGNGNNILLITRRGSLCGIDMFISDTNFNGYVVATAGGGKSMFLQFLAYCSYMRGDRVFVLDIGRSQEKLCKALGGQFLDLDPKHPISFNPFSVIDSEKTLQEELEYLTDWCYMLGGNINKAIAEAEEKLIKSYLGNIIKEVYAEKGASAEITDVQGKMSELAKTEQDARCKDFARQMSIYCKGGIYEPFFVGRSQVDFGNDYIVAELQHIENDANIRDPIIMMLIYHLNKSAFKDKSAKRKRLVAIIDEAHKFLGKNPRMDDFIEQAYRRFRKENGSIVIATQGFDDIYREGQLSRAGAAIVNSSAWKFFLKQTETSINLLIKSEMFNLTDYEQEIMRAIATVKGEYGEIFLMTPDNLKTPVRLLLNRYFYYLASSDPKDKRMIQETMERHKVDTSKAIRILIEQERAAKRKRL